MPAARGRCRSRMDAGSKRGGRSSPMFIPSLSSADLSPLTPRASASSATSPRAGPGTMMIHLALDGLPDWRAGEALRRFAYVHVAPDLEMMARVYAEASAGLLPAEPVLVVGQPTAIDPTRAPAGQHVLWVQARVLPAEISGDAKGEIAAKAWDDAKAPLCGAGARHTRVACA